MVSDIFFEKNPSLNYVFKFLGHGAALANILVVSPVAAGLYIISLFFMTQFPFKLNPIRYNISLMRDLFDLFEFEWKFFHGGASV